MKKFELVIDHELCWGCKTCEVACKQEHNMPYGIKLISISENGHQSSGEKLNFLYQATVCQHCEKPPCVDSCYEAAIYKRADGIVVLDSDRCTGCASCLKSCPYSAIAFDEAGGTARKCNLCYHRVDGGLYPACADNVCLAHCIHFIVEK
jgi:Fe-S-cluster-containing dehydrogenase component